MIRVYFADTKALDSDELFYRYYEDLSEERRKKIDRMVYRKDKNLSLCAGILIDSGLSEYGYREKNVKYGYGENGKPYFRDLPGIYFNVSHSKDKVMAAFSDNEIGCDIEYAENIDMNIAKRFFHPGEYAAIMQKPDDTERRKLFYRFWVLKESYMKATGKGFALPTRDFEIKITDESISVTDEKYLFREIEICGNYRCAVCSVDDITIKDVYNVYPGLGKITVTELQ